MKKLFNSRFLFILASSLVVLIGLGAGAFYLFDDSDDVFIKSGYVLNPLSSTSEKYFFDENTEYKENLSSMVEFKDVDENEVSVLKDSFLHYMDDSLSFLKKGAILDLDSIDGKSAVSFYNITNKSLIEKDGKGYKIESVSGDIKFNNFIGRINDNKYIVVGDLNLKMPGNSTYVKGSYFEIVYVEEGIVNIENKEVKYQVAAEGTLINVGSDVVIDLGDKKITVDGEDLMSITAITINGDENIEIIPKGNEEEENATGNNDNVNDGTSNNNDEQQDSNPENDNSGNNDETGGDASGGTGNENAPTEEIKELIVTLKDAEIGSTNINVTFDVENAKEEDKFMLQVVNLTTGRTVDITAQVLSDVSIKVNLLTPNTKYLFTVVNEKDKGKYFQKVFETTDFGIKLEKTYATDNSLAYKVTVSEGTDITNAKLTLYKYNEETKQNEVVKTSYQESGETKYEEKVTYLSDYGNVIEGEHEIIYSGLDSDTIYTAVLDEFSVASSNFKDVYNITNTSMTLKKIPKFSEMTVTKDVGEGSFELSLGNIIDEDNAIVNYKYVIYDQIEKKVAVEIDKNNASPLTVLIGEGKDKLKNDINYYYNVIIEYFDNEKYVEYVTTDSITFMMGNDPYITVEPNMELVTHEQIAATIYLTDNSCLISMPGREKCGDSSSTVVEVNKINLADGSRTLVYSELVNFEIDSNTGSIKYDLLVNKNLQPGYTYDISVYANYGDSNGIDLKEIQHTDESIRTITTKALATFNVEWTTRMGDDERVIDSGAKFIAQETTNSLSGDESIKVVDEVIIKLYAGSSVNNLDAKTPIATRVLDNNNIFNIEQQFYRGSYTITSDGTFNLDFDRLVELSGGTLSKYYVMKIEAYTATGDMVNLTNNILSYRVNPSLFVEVGTTLKMLKTIKKEKLETGTDAANYFENLINGGTVVGYQFQGSWGTAALKESLMTPNAINITVFNDKNEPINFWYKNEDGKLELSSGSLKVPLGKEYKEYELNSYEFEIYLDYGTPYDVVDDVLRRGNKFVVQFELMGTDSSKESFTDLDKTESMFVAKEMPDVKMYVASSDSNSITYKYKVVDVDGALYKETNTDTYGFYVVKGGTEKKIEMKKISSEDNKNTFEDMTDGIKITGLGRGEVYSLYYKLNTAKTGDPTKDIVNYINGTSDSGRTFDGYYDFSGTDKSGFKYQIINNPETDNRVIIKILVNDNILDRILAYKLKFKDSKGNELDKELSVLNLFTCDGDDEETAKKRCLSVDYTDLNAKGMMTTDTSKPNMISVSISALYDNGKTGYDYIVGTGSEAQYRYMIMQNNSTSLGLGSYVTFARSGKDIVVWTDKLGIQKGYYSYSITTGDSTKIKYFPEFNTKWNELEVSVNLTGAGYLSSQGILEPKMISTSEMGVVCNTGQTNCNQFYFSSVIPKVKVTSNVSLVDGEIKNLRLSGVVINGFGGDTIDGVKGKYLYMEVWDNLDDVGDFSKRVRPTVTSKINESSPATTMNVRIDGLKEGKKYYFNVYYKMGDKLVQIFDANSSSNELVTYEIYLRSAENMLSNKYVSIVPSEETYGNRSLKTRIELRSYGTNSDGSKINYNFDVVYEVCDADKVNEKRCGPYSIGESNYIFRQTIEDVKVSLIEDLKDISELDNISDGVFEYGKSYYIYIYLQFDAYTSSDGDTEKRLVIVNPLSTNAKFSVNSLSEPEFTAERSATMVDMGDDGKKYAIDLAITANDEDRTLIEGKYYIKVFLETGGYGDEDDSNDILLEDINSENTGDIKVSMEAYDLESGMYSPIGGDYQEYAFNGFEVGKKIRFIFDGPNELIKGKMFKVLIYGDVELNNFGLEEKIRTVKKTYSIYTTNELGVAVGEVKYSMTEKTVIATFVGGSSFDNVKQVSYTIKDLVTNVEVSGVYETPKDKTFEFYESSDTWRFVISPRNMKNIDGRVYLISISMVIPNPDGEGDITLTSAEISSFEQTEVYNEDDIKK